MIDTITLAKHKYLPIQGYPIKQEKNILYVRYKKNELSDKDNYSIFKDDISNWNITKETVIYNDTNPYTIDADYKVIEDK